MKPAAEHDTERDEDLTARRASEVRPAEALNRTGGNPLLPAIHDRPDSSKIETIPLKLERPASDVPADVSEISAAELPLLDEKIVAWLAAQAASRELLALYLEEGTELIKQLQQTLAQGDAVATSKIAHNLKGSSGYAGAKAAQALAAGLEKLGNAGALEAMRPLLTKLEAVFAQTDAAIRPYLGPLPPA